MTDDKTNVPEYIDVTPKRKSGKGEGLFFFKNLSEVPFTKRVAGSFAFVSLLTIMVAFGILSMVWEFHFQSYTQDNMERLAVNAAGALEEELELLDGKWTVETVDPMQSASRLNEDVNFQVVSADGEVRYDSSSGEDKAHSLNYPNSPRSHTVSAPVNYRGYQVATVYVWVYGSETVLTEADETFRNQSYMAMFIAIVVSAVISLCIGHVFARSLVDPINRITSTARAIKEGDEGARTGMRGNDEISKLGETFDAMAESIAKDRQIERRLTTDVAHELRTPLMAIQATVEAMVDGVFEPDAERLATIDAEVQRLSRLVDAQLRLSRLENRKTPINKAKVNLGDVIADVVATHEAYVHDAGLDFRFEKQDDVYVFGDADMLRQATANLISNAVRYTQEGSVTVRVYKGDIMASIQVSDTGIGLSSEEAKRVFDRFWRGDASRNRAQGGLGVGLSVVKEIVDRHNGWVRVEGKKGEGATFTILIPLYEDRQVTANSKQAKQQAKQAKQQARQQQKQAKHHKQGK